jgi:hypothetical protein
MGKDAALVFPTGYQANLGVISALAGPGDVLLIDKLNHASMVDGATLSGAEVVRFRHGDLKHLEARLTRAAGRPKMVIVDGVFSMEGDLADVPRIADMCDAHSARLVVDDAHGVGVFGETGAGVSEHFGMTPRVDPLPIWRVDIEDAVSAHVQALERAPSIGFGRYIISATSPFSPDELPELRANAPCVVKRRFPAYEAAYARRGWTMFPGIDRVYVNDRARKELGWRPRYDFGYVLDLLQADEDLRSPLARAVGIKGYHATRS